MSRIVRARTMHPFTKHQTLGKLLAVNKKGQTMEGGARDAKDRALHLAQCTNSDSGMCRSARSVMAIASRGDSTTNSGSKIFVRRSLGSNLSTCPPAGTGWPEF